MLIYLKIAQIFQTHLLTKQVFITNKKYFVSQTVQICQVGFVQVFLLKDIIQLRIIQKLLIQPQFDITTNFKRHYYRTLDKIEIEINEKD